MTGHRSVPLERPDSNSSTTTLTPIIACINGERSVVSMEPSAVTDVSAKPKSRGTCELKFLIDRACAAEIKEWARRHLDPDPHSDPACDDGYHVNGLYLDTPHLDVFHRSDFFRQRKFRLRRYGHEPLIWLELKRKRRGLVMKRRVSLNEADLIRRLTQPSDDSWDGHWFRRRLDEQQLNPVTQVGYVRFARVKPLAEGSIRLTIDDGLAARPAIGWQVPSQPFDGIPLQDETSILELKFRAVMPTLFRQLIEQFQLVQTSFSKYRTSVEECVPLDWIAGERCEGMENA